MIAWSRVKSATEAADLQGFLCTDPAGAGVDEYGDAVLESEWEWEAQAGLQSAPCPPPAGEYVILGRDDDGTLAAVCWWAELDGPSSVKILGIGVAVHLRGRGLGIGDQMLTEVLTQITENAAAAGEERALVLAMVDRSNGPSQGLLERHGFFYRGDDHYYQKWWLRLDVPNEDDMA